jgi:pectin methylesterase-like acyl-CoA thioesterase
VGRFVRPETVTLTLENGDRLIVRKRLSAGQQRARLARCYVTAPDGATRLNGLEIGRATMLAYLVDWTITDEGEPVPIRGLSEDELAAVVDNLEGPDFREVREAIEAHERREADAREDEKKTAVGSLS